MRFVVKSVPAGDFDAWLAQARGTGSGLDDASYAELAKPSKAVPPTTYRSVEPKLFERIIDQTTAGSGNAAIGGARASATGPATGWSSVGAGRGGQFPLYTAAPPPRRRT